MARTILIALAAVLAAGIAGAQQPPSGIKRTPLQKVEFPDGYVTVSGLAELPAGGRIGRHTHPGIETGYLLEGEALMTIDGQPDKHLKAGDSYSIPAGVVHDAAAHGGGAKVMAVWVVDKTKPLSSPAP
ncbi:cupin domain-containing protein [Rhodopseudomonas palustris]|uniref:Cupin domain-containing protein n=1 Tax=Rhodopseudomonas palustris TaxID=1076 RepID=A0A418UXA8_RHOPL|nr:cupin domain-containing protein [Rhodopseudomonas palustris]RJF65257.1 cupin domain-containing protein [Rhodopseudomonas palustris]